MMKRSILIGSLSGPKFAIRTAKMDRAQIDFTEHVLFEVEICSTIIYNFGKTFAKNV